MVLMMSGSRRYIAEHIVTIYLYCPIRCHVIFASPLESDFYSSKNDDFQMKNCDIFLIFAQNINVVCGYIIEQTH